MRTRKYHHIKLRGNEMPSMKAQIGSPSNASKLGAEGFKNKKDKEQQLKDKGGK